MGTPHSLYNIVDELIATQNTIINGYISQTKEILRALHADHPNTVFLTKTTNQKLDEIMNQRDLQKQSMSKKIESLHKQKEDFLTHIQKKNETSYDSISLFLNEYEDAMLTILYELFEETSCNIRTQCKQLNQLLQKEKNNQNQNYN